MQQRNKTIAVCSYCGEYVGVTQKYCSTCRTQAGRKKIFDANAEILKENQKLGYTTPTELRNWK